MKNRQICRVAVTGLGAISGLGHNVDSNWNNIVQGKSGISRIENIDTERLSVKIAGEVKNFNIASDLLDPKDVSHFDTFIQFALHSANEAISDAQIQIGTTHLPERSGVILGIGMGGFHLVEKGYETFRERGEKRVSPFAIPSIIPNMGAGLISIKFGLKGSNYALTSACASAGHAISIAAQEIMLGHQDLIITGGSESVIAHFPIAGFHAMKALSRHSGDPVHASRPFDSHRDGFVMGEGAGILVLENYEMAQKRGAKIYAELISFGSTSDAYHIAAPEPEGLGASRAMKLAIESAGITPSDVQYINAHGTSTPLGDVAETRAIKNCFGDHAKNLYISSTKSMTGHLLGAAGGIESIFTVLALHHGILPPTINLNHPDPECDLNYLPIYAKRENIQYALNNSFGFGGTNSTILFKRYNS